MGGTKRLVRPLSVIATVVVAVLVIVSFVFLRHDVSTQEKTLLQSDDDQLALVLNQAITGLGSSLTSLGQVMAATNNSPGLFQSEAKAITANPGTSVALAQSGGGHFKVVLTAGKAFAVGQTLSGPVATAAAIAGPRLTSTPVFSSGTMKLFGFLVSAVPGTVVVQLSQLSPSTPSPSQPGPYSQLYFSLYASKTADPSQLVLSSLGVKPLPGLVVHTFSIVGDKKWLTLASARTSLVGGASSSAPWIVLASGMVIALMIGVISEVLARRRVYAENIAAERTLELTAAQAALVRKERLSAVGEMATVIGHELRNPLGAAINLLYLARTRLSDHDDTELDGYLDRLERETNRAASLCEDLTSYMREREAVLIPVELGSVVDEVLESTPPPAGIEIGLGFLGVDVQADRAQLVQMLTNLITNAYQAMPDGGTLRVSGGERDGYFEISVEDSGEGIDPEVADRLLEPFFTTKAVGTGLGLAIVKRFADAHNGTVSLKNGETGGARVTIGLPYSPEGVPS